MSSQVKFLSHSRLVASSGFFSDIAGHGHGQVKSLHKQQTTYYGKPIEEVLSKLAVEVRRESARRRRRDRYMYRARDLT